MAGITQWEMVLLLGMHKDPFRFAEAACSWRGEASRLSAECYKGEA